MLQIGSIVDGKYKVLNKIGQGGMSVVYLALNEKANKTWAIKEVRKDGVQDFATVKQGLIAETNILKSLDHKYLPSIIDVIEDEDTFLIVMDYIQGKSLKEVLQENLEQEGFPIPVDELLSWSKQLCDVFYYLHTRPKPIIYRDMKPANVMLKPDGEISLIDFGTARVMKTGDSDDTTCLGTPGYAAPEQYGGKGQSKPQTDIYCLGATMHHLITGRNPSATPFNFPKITQCRPSLLEETPRELRNALLGLEMIIDKCTQYNIADRYQSCAELKYDLEHPEELGLPYRKKLKNKMAAFGACAGMSVVLGGVSLFGLFMENRTEQSGYDGYIEQANSDIRGLQFDDAIEAYTSAIKLNPSREDAYIGMLELMLSNDGDERKVLSSEEYTKLREILNSKDNGRVETNEFYFKTNNEAGYVRYAYQSAFAHYFQSESGKNTVAAGAWFDIVAKADMESLDIEGTYDSNEEVPDTASWQKQSIILDKICEYSNNIGYESIPGQTEVTYEDYWNDMMMLMSEDTIGEDTYYELLLYEDIAIQIHDRVTEFNAVGISQDDMEEALDTIQDRMDAMNLYKQTTKLGIKADIEEVITSARRNISSFFTTNKTAGTTGEEGGQS